MSHALRRDGHTLLAVAALLVLAACAPEGGSGDLAGDGHADLAGDVLPAAPLAEDPGLTHVHGLGRNPADGRIYVATHFGLWRLDEDGSAERVGQAFHDLMGFTVVGPDHFLASGHPVLTDDLPPLLGLIESTDAGVTWRSRSLLGAADFHALRAAHDLVYGWNATDGQFMVSADGAGWERRSAPQAVVDFAVDPADPDRLVATAATSLEETVLLASSDGGRSWIPRTAPPLLRLAWAGDGLWAVAADGGVWRHDDPHGADPDGHGTGGDGDGGWRRTGAVAGVAEAVTQTGDALVVAAGGAIVESADGGRTWRELHRYAAGQDDRG